MSRLAHLALRARAESATGFPIAREHENVPFTKPTDGTAYSEEDFVPATRGLETIGASGLVIAAGLYAIRLYFPAGTGIKDLSGAADAIVDLFPADWSASLADNTTVRVKRTTLATRGQIVNATNDYARCLITIPWEHWNR